MGGGTTSSKPIQWLWFFLKMLLAGFSLVITTDLTVAVKSDICCCNIGSSICLHIRLAFLAIGDFLLCLAVGSTWMKLELASKQKPVLLSFLLRLYTLGCSLSCRMMWWVKASDSCHATLIHKLWLRQASEEKDVRNRTVRAYKKGTQKQNTDTKLELKKWALIMKVQRTKTEKEQKLTQKTQKRIHNLNQTQIRITFRTQTWTQVINRQTDKKQRETPWLNTLKTNLLIKH